MPTRHDRYYSSLPERSGAPISLISKSEFIADIGAAVTNGRGYAAGKIGFSEQRWMYYPIFLDSNPERGQRKAYELMLKFHCERQAGIFPSNPEFIQLFNEAYVNHVRSLDCLGITGGSAVRALVSHYDLPCKLIDFMGHEPDRSTPVDDAKCYLRYFKGKRLLLLAPFAQLLKQRAERDIFEGVWSKIGKRWFHPAAVDAIEFPYGYVTSDKGGFESCLELLSDITARVDRCEFDVALIAAGALAIPLASHIKRTGRVAVSLGGHLQVLFGVVGQRWRGDASWRRDYFNHWWIDMPECYHPPDKKALTDGGAYW